MISEWLRQLYVFSYFVSIFPVSPLRLFFISGTTKVIRIRLRSVESAVEILSQVMNSGQGLSRRLGRRGGETGTRTGRIQAG